MKRNVLLWAALVVVSGCASQVMVDGHSVYADDWNHARSTLLSRASFDLGCKRESIKLTLLNDDMHYPQQVGAQGCNQRITYVMTHGEWVANVAARNQPGGRR